MYGKPKDVTGQCNARLYLSDDYGDGTCTVMCQLLPNHEGLHQEITGEDPVTITWKLDQREVSLICTIAETDPTKVEAILDSVYPHGYINDETNLPRVEVRCISSNVEKISELPGIISVENKGFVDG